MPAFLATFLAVATVLLVFAAPLTTAYNQLITVSGVPHSSVVGVPMRLRFMFWAVLALFPLFQPGHLSERLWLAGAALLTYGFATAGLDRMTVLARPSDQMPGLPAADTVIAGLLGYVLFSCLLFVRTRMPADRRVSAVLDGHWYGRREFVLALLASVGATWLSAGPGHAITGQARNVGVIGGVGPGLLVFFPALSLAVVALGTRRLAIDRKERAALAPPASVAVLVPAYNEEHIIGACIQSIDQAAREYWGSTRIYVVDNASRDRTAELARAALAACKYASGQLLECPERGKSKALNRGLARIEEPIVIRIDSDTRVSNGAIAGCVRHFADPKVGAVGGLPLPDTTSHFIGRMRAIEVYTVHGFTRIGWAATDVMLGVPGMFAGYRRSCLRELGGFVEGMNGEDTDIALGIARLGYALVADPTLVVWTEVPATLAQLREQRLRWFRAGLHVFARNRSAVLMHQGIRSVWGLPWSVLQTARRAMLLPLLLFSMLTWALDPNLLPLRHGAAIIAVLVGPPLLLPAVALLRNREYALLRQLPGYVLFRLLRAYLTLDSMLTLQLRASIGESLSRHPRERPRGRRRREAQRLGIAPDAGTLSNRVVDRVPRRRPHRVRTGAVPKPTERDAASHAGRHRGADRGNGRRRKPRSAR